MTERPIYPKSTCCAPGCPRWSRMYPGEWLCGRHWKMVPRRLRRALRVLWKRRPWTMRDGRLETRLWAHARRRVILQEAGL